MDLPPSSNSPASQSEDKEQREEEQYHVHFEKKMKAAPQMAHVPCKRKSVKTIVSTTLKKKCPTFLDNNLNIGLDFGNNPSDSVLLGLDSLMAADDADDVTNLFDFK